MSQGRIHFPALHGLVDVWRWRATRSVVFIEAPCGLKRRVPLTTLTECTWTEIERCRHKQARGCEVTPAKVRHYIEQEIMQKIMQKS